MNKSSFFCWASLKRNCFKIYLMEGMQRPNLLSWYDGISRAISIECNELDVLEVRMALDNFEEEKKSAVLGQVKPFGKSSHERKVYQKESYKNENGRQYRMPIEKKKVSWSGELVQEIIQQMINLCKVSRRSYHMCNCQSHRLGQPSQPRCPWNFYRLGSAFTPKFIKSPVIKPTTGPLFRILEGFNAGDKINLASPGNHGFKKWRRVRKKYQKVS